MAVEKKEAKKRQLKKKKKKTGRNKMDSNITAHIAQLFKERISIRQEIIVIYFLAANKK